jgi:hypothetical protein
MLIKSQLYCLLILRPQSGTRGEICTPNLLTLDQVPLLVGLRERKVVAATGLAPVRSGLKDRSLDLLCIRGQRLVLKIRPPGRTRTCIAHLSSADRV